MKSEEDVLHEPSQGLGRLTLPARDDYQLALEPRAQVYPLHFSPPAVNCQRIGTKLTPIDRAAVIHEMASPEYRTPENVAGPYYVDDTCIDCDLCRDTAPQFFRRHDAGGYSVVYRQPTTPEEIALADEARQACPTDTIGNDGG